MSIPKKLLLSLFLLAFLTSATSSIFFGWSEFLGALGGAKSFGGLLALVAMAAVVGGGSIYLQNQTYNGWSPRRITHVVIAIGLAFTLGFIGLSWVNLPDGNGAKVLIVVVVHVIIAALLTFTGELESSS